MKRVLNFLVLLLFLTSVKGQDSLKYYIEKGESYYSNDKYDLALDFFKKAKIKYPDSYEANLGFANTLHKKEMFDEAIKAYNVAEELNNTDVDLYFGRGAAKVFLEDYKGSIKDMNRAIDMDANNPKLYYYKGYSEAELGRYKTAITDYSKAIELKPDYADAYYNRGAAKAELKSFEEGMKDFELAVDKDPKLENGLINIALSKLGMKKYEEAIEDLTEVIEKRNANLARAYYYRGEAYFEIKEKEKACTDWTKSSNLDYDLATQNLKDFCGSTIKERKRDIKIVF